MRSIQSCMLRHLFHPPPLFHARGNVMFCKCTHLIAAHRRNDRCWTNRTVEIRRPYAERDVRVIDSCSVIKLHPFIHEYMPALAADIVPCLDISLQVVHLQHGHHALLHHILSNRLSFCSPLSSRVVQTTFFLPTVIIQWIQLSEIHSLFLISEASTDPVVLIERTIFL